MPSSELGSEKVLSDLNYKLIFFELLSFSPALN